MNYIILDLEWNQGMNREQTDPRMPFEIIEIGAVKLNEELRLVSQFGCLIKPKRYKKIHYKIEEVTHLSTNELNQKGRKFKEVICEFLKWCGEDYIFCTWGTMDLTELERNIRYHGMKIPFPKPLLYYDLQKIYSILCKDGDDKSVALDTAVDELGLPKKRPFHRAKDDAYYTACVMREMGFDRGKEYYSVDYYRAPSNRSEEIWLKSKEGMEFTSMAYPTREELLADKVVTSTECFYCKKKLRKKIHWFTINSKQYFALAYCPEHGYLAGRMRIRKTDDDQNFAVKTLQFTDEQGADEIRQKQKEMYKKRRQRMLKQMALKTSENGGQEENQKKTTWKVISRR